MALPNADWGRRGDLAITFDDAAEERACRQQEQVGLVPCEGLTNEMVGGQDVGNGEAHEKISLVMSNSSTRLGDRENASRGDLIAVRCDGPDSDGAPFWLATADEDVDFTTNDAGACESQYRTSQIYIV